MPTYLPDDPAFLLKAKAEAELDLKRQKQSAREAGPLNGRVTVFIGRTSHSLPQRISVAELAQRLSGGRSDGLLVDGARVAGEVELVGGETIEIADGK